MVLTSMLQTAQEPDSRTLTRRQVRARQANSGWGRALRYLGLILGIYAGWNIGVRLAPEDAGADSYGYPVIISASLGALLFLLSPYLTIGVVSIVRDEVRRVEASDLAAVAAGLLIGGLVSTLLALPLGMLPDPLGQFAPVLALAVICSITILSTLTKKRELMNMAGFRREPEADTASDQHKTESATALRTTSRPQLLLDTSAIIDGRIRGLSAAGFLPFQLIIPQFVLHELQLVADSNDYTRRNRGIRGLETLEEMRQHPEIEIEIRQIDAEGPDVDSQLVNVARTLNVPVLSGDSNLERVASLQDVQVLNLHNLAELMRPALAVGDSFDLKLVQKGREYQQGVGFLEDGTMVVVDGGEPHVGELVGIVITRTIQTSSGRMMFARLASPETPAP